MYLVSRIEQAQSGRGVRDSSEEVPLSLTIEPRWLEAVTQYCNRRVSLDDVAKVCAAFPELIEVKWVVRDRTDLLYKEVAEAEHSNRSPKSSPKRGKKKTARHWPSGQDR
ncbi:hypothetical protein AGDE_13722 [Angomonas deanei]|uniref:Uncharacterized protein n=1 Tax=Angomonas deanei TaxID=59799 RepID=A0A7G2C5I5_9TRYP|nr:hypothetical protein AGDE_13722 [Angomonas deanei]CAD2213192.1 hypothetical protein, conserved [Angomonas deanei]|eukprot:EPY21920.1 hypothetical protein AGDE_13722 [Angomonas deanei]